MNIGLNTEGRLLRSQAIAERYREILEQVELADASGFDVFTCAEQHFNLPSCTFSAPEIILAHLAGRTRRIRLRSGVALLPFHNPLQIAEQYAAIDILSRGRLELGAGRGNAVRTAEAFGVPVAESAPRLREALEIIVGAWTKPEFSYDGKFWKVPPVTVAPTPVQKPHPPLWMSAISPESHVTAGHLGVGVMSLTAGVAFHRVVERIETYEQAIREARPLSTQVNNRVSLFCLLHCADSKEKARRVAREPMLDWLAWAMDLYEATVKRTNPEVDFSRMKAMLSDWERLEREDMVIVGEPGYCLEQLARYAEAGADEVLIRQDGIPHHDTMRSFELLAAHVIPELKKLSAAGHEPREANTRGAVE